MPARQTNPLSTQILDAFRTGHAHQQAGRLDLAERFYNKVLRRAPQHADTLHLLGVIANERGRHVRAIQLIGQAIQALPDFADYHVNLGNAQRAAGQGSAAIASYRRAIVIKPSLAAAHSNLARALNDQGIFAEALESARLAIDLVPGLAEARVNMAVSLTGLQLFSQAEAVYRQALALQPNRAATWRDLGLVLAELQRFDEAIPSLEKAVSVAPADASVHAALGRTLFGARKLAEAEASFRRALALSAGDAQALTGLGMLLASTGRFEEAEQFYRQALATDPDYAEAHRGLAAIGLGAGDDAAFARLSHLAAKPGLPVRERVAAGFALGTLLDKADRFDEAFARFSAANALMHDRFAQAGDAFDLGALAREVDRLIACVSPAFFESAAGQGNMSETPVFVVGMPRSGTSLIEQIAASHSEVFGAGELKHVSGLADALRRRAGDAYEIRAVADAHVGELDRLGGGAVRVIDKMPDNIFHLGLIAALFPAARVIFARRDPRDTCLSCYFQRFTEQNVFAYDLAECGRRAVEVERLTAHWRRVLPLRMLDLEYEALVADPESQSRRLIAFLGLEWEPGCLDFHQTSRAVLTSSAWQVRQPLYARSVGRWRQYERYLGPLFRALESK